MREVKSTVVAINRVRTYTFLRNMVASQEEATFEGSITRTILIMLLALPRNSSNIISTLVSIFINFVVHHSPPDCVRRHGIKLCHD